ncbi:hypothetical protein [Streptomyces wuyuanensis]|uniref:hypothetical protein n=1 Tax=Streptomyces wuyuanensis TaxID=1196353 RepID=UPI00342CBFE6
MTAIPESLRDLLAAISEALEVPAPALDRDAEAAYRWHVEDRIMLVQSAIKDVRAGEATLGLDWEANYLRDRVAERPARYRTRDQAIAEREGGRS